MRRALATSALAAGIALSGAPLLAAPAFADSVVVASGDQSPQDSETDNDEPLTQDGNDDSGKYGLIGLSGLFGLFGYKKYRDHRAAQRRSATGPVGDVDADGSGSRRV